jgi:heptosyltransferase-1
MQSSPRRILIIKPSSLGDVVHALPVLAVLRRSWPAAHIAWLVSSSFAPLLDRHPMLNEVIPFDRAHFGRIWRSPRIFADFWRLVAKIRRRRFELVIDQQGLIRSGLLALLSGARRRVGFATAREGAWLFYSHRVKPAATVEHAVDRNLLLAKALGLQVEEPEFPLALQPSERAAAKDLLTEAAGGQLEAFTAIVPGARWKTKRWPADRLAALIDRLQSHGLPRCVLLGSPNDRAVADEIVRTCRSDVVNLVGRTDLKELTALMDLASCVVCHDSGPMHIAAALAKPMVAIFGPTNPARTGPYSPTASVVTHPVPCAPCYRRTCPYQHHNCMRRLDVERVFNAVRASQMPR